MRPVAEHFPWFTTDLTQGYPHRIELPDGTTRYVIRFPKTWERHGPKTEHMVADPKGEAYPVAVQTYKVLTWEEFDLAGAGVPVKNGE